MERTRADRCFPWRIWWREVGKLNRSDCRKSCANPRTTQLRLFVASALGNSGLTKDSKRAVEAGFRGCFRRYVFRSPEDFHAERLVVVDALERLQESGQVDDTFSGQQTLIVVDLLWRQVRRVIEMDVHNAISAGGDDVLWGRSCVVPVPGIEQQSDVGTTFLGEREHI